MKVCWWEDGDGIASTESVAESKMLGELGSKLEV